MFGSKKVKAASELTAAIDGLTKSFTTMVEVLNQTSQEAETIKADKEKEIKELQQECDNLKAVSERATGLAAKIANIFN